MPSLANARFHFAKKVDAVVFVQATVKRRRAEGVIRVSFEKRLVERYCWKKENLERNEIEKSSFRTSDIFVKEGLLGGEDTIM